MPTSITITGIDTAPGQSITCWLNGQFGLIANWPDDLADLKDSTRRMIRVPTDNPTEDSADLIGLAALLVYWRLCQYDTLSEALQNIGNLIGKTITMDWQAATLAEVLTVQDA